MIHCTRPCREGYVKISEIVIRGVALQMIGIVEIICYKAILNLRSEARKKRLSYVWWVLEPLLYLAVFYLAFSKIFHRGESSYFLYLISGIVPWLWLSKSVTSSANSICSQNRVLQSFKLQAVIFPAISILQALLKQIPAFGLLFALFVLHGIYPNIYWFGLIPVMLVQLCFIAVISLTLSMLIPFYKDFSVIVANIIHLGMFISGVVHRIDLTQSPWHFYYQLNPMVTILNGYRDILIAYRWPAWSTLAWITIGSLVCIFLLLKLMNRFNNVYPRIILE